MPALHSRLSSFLPTTCNRTEQDQCVVPLPSHLFLLPSTPVWHNTTDHSLLHNFSSADFSQESWIPRCPSRLNLIIVNTPSSTLRLELDLIKAALSKLDPCILLTVNISAYLSSVFYLGSSWGQFVSPHIISLSHIIYCLVPLFPQITTFDSSLSIYIISPRRAHVHSSSHLSTSLSLLPSFRPKDEHSEHLLHQQSPLFR